MMFSNVSMLSNKTHEMYIPMEEGEFEERYIRWLRGALIQDAFPSLSDEQREFIKTGITQEEWDAAFPKEEEDVVDDDTAWDGDFSY